jgi:very-short-patch-repair endonuclease
MNRCECCGNMYSTTRSYNQHVIKCKKIMASTNDIIVDYNEGKSQRYIKNKYHIQSSDIKSLLQEHNITIRDSSMAGKLAHQKYPNSYKHSDESKQNLREKRIAWMKANPEKTAWRTRNTPSYPEKLFMQLCKDNSLYDTYDIVREYSVGLFYIDFAFVNAKVAVEIDGSQHWLDSDRIERDIRKEFKLKQSYQEIVGDIISFLYDVNLAKKKYGDDIIEYEVIRKGKLNAKETERRLKAKKVEAVVKLRRQDFDEVYPSVGWSVALGNKWGIKSQKAAEYCRKHFDIGTEHVRITKEQIEDCLSLKMSLRAIGRKYDIHADTVGDYCRKYGIEIPSPVYKVDWDSIDLESVLEDHSLSEIARQLEVTPAAVRRRAKKLGLM